MKNEDWFAETSNESGKYIVGYKAIVGNLENLPRWEVTNSTIKALNGAAITLTPELGPQEDRQTGSDFEKEVYEYSTSLYKKYEQVAGDSAEKLKEAEERSIKETAQKFNITEEEVVRIISKLQ